VTIPNFEIRGSDVRVQADATNILWLPLVTDENPCAWKNMPDKPFSDGRSLSGGCETKEKQDEEFGRQIVVVLAIGCCNSLNRGTILIGQDITQNLVDGDFSQAGDEAEGNSYLPFWQVKSSMHLTSCVETVVCFVYLQHSGT
jgi:hypothetical protein